MTMPPFLPTLLATALITEFGVIAAPAAAQVSSVQETSLLMAEGGWERLTRTLPKERQIPRLAQAAPTDTRQTEADQLLEQGGQQYRVRQYQATLQSYQAALEIYRELDNRLGESRTLQGIGIVYGLLDDYPQALESFQQALAIQQEIGDLVGEGATLNNIGEVYRLLGNYTQALKYYQQSLA